MLLFCEKVVFLTTCVAFCLVETKYPENFLPEDNAYQEEYGEELPPETRYYHPEYIGYHSDYEEEMLPSYEGNEKFLPKDKEYLPKDEKGKHLLSEKEKGKFLPENTGYYPEDGKLLPSEKEIGKNVPEDKEYLPEDGEGELRPKEEYLPDDGKEEELPLKREYLPEDGEGELPPKEEYLPDDGKEVELPSKGEYLPEDGKGEHPPKEEYLPEDGKGELPTVEEYLPEDGKGELPTVEEYLPEDGKGVEIPPKEEYLPEDRKEELPPKEEYLPEDGKEEHYPTYKGTEKLPEEGGQEYLPPKEEEGGKPLSNVPCNYGNLDGLANLIISRVRPAFPDTFPLPDVKEGPFWLRTFYLEGVAQFDRRTSPAVACSDYGVTLIVPLHWQRPLLGSFTFGFAKFERKVKVVIKRLEAEAVLDLEFRNVPRYVVHVRSVRLTRFYDPKVTTEGFGVFRNAADLIARWMIKLFQERIRHFISEQFQETLDREMLKVVIGKEDMGKKTMY